MSIHRWEIIFKTLANVNRLKIIRLLEDGQKLNVSDISEKIKISFSATSRHLIILQRVGVLEDEGTAGHVFYSLNPNLPNDLKRALKLFTNH